MDFQSPSVVDGPNGVMTTASTNFNAFGVQAADGATATFAGTVIDTSNNSLPGVGIEVDNNSGKASGLTGVAGVATTVVPFNENSLYTNTYGSATVGDPASREEEPINTIRAFWWKIDRRECFILK